MQKELKELLNDKASGMNQDAHNTLNKVSDYIKQLNAHINKEINLSNAEIERKIDFLIGDISITLEYPLEKGIKLIRAVKYNEKEAVKNIPCYKDVSRLSYIPECSDAIPSIGRLNKEGESIYYGCIYFHKPTFHVAFAEINALTEDKINILKSITHQEIKLDYIGMIDNIYRQNKPKYISDEIYHYYEELYEYMEKIFKRALFTSFLLMDAFLADILSRPNSERLYPVTSCLASIYLDGKRSDGIVYSSVQAKGSPVVALKPKTVDDKVKHIDAECFQILKEYGYAKYSAQKLYEGKIKDKYIQWDIKDFYRNKKCQKIY